MDNLRELLGLRRCVSLVNVVTCVQRPTSDCAKVPLEEKKEGRLEDEEDIDKFRNLRELLGLRRRFSHVNARWFGNTCRTSQRDTRSHLRDTLNCARETPRRAGREQNPKKRK